MRITTPKTISFVLVLATLFGFTTCRTEPDDEIDNDNDKVTLSAAEHELYNLIMSYRAELSLPQIPLSSSLSFVAQQHVADLQENNPVTATCNLHSWSDNGNWTACCYTSDHAQAACMWNKPRELTDYTGNGYEIAFAHSASATPTGALNGWKGSPGHNDVIINAGIWTTEWNAIGVGIQGRYAVVWFGHEEDPAGPPR